MKTGDKRANVTYIDLCSPSMKDEGYSNLSRPGKKAAERSAKLVTEGQSSFLNRGWRDLRRQPSYNFIFSNIRNYMRESYKAILYV